jgi:tRNA (mo5U34)-methyltransferase
MLRSAGFSIVSHPELEVHICRSRPERPTDGAVYPATRKDA